MRIFCAVRHSNDSRHYYGGLWSGNLYPALRQRDHEIIESQVDLLSPSRFVHARRFHTLETSRSYRWPSQPERPTCGATPRSSAVITNWLRLDILLGLECPCQRESWLSFD